MYKILVKEVGSNGWDFTLDSYFNEKTYKSVEDALKEVDNLLDFYTRRNIKIVTEVKFDTKVVELDKNRYL